MNGTVMHALSGLSASPLARLGFKYWWLILPAGGLVWLRVQRKRKKPGFEWIDVLDDVALVTMITVPLIQLAECMPAQQVGGLAGASAPPRPAPAPVPGPIIDAAFKSSTPIPQATPLA